MDSPLVITTLQATALSALSNILGQLIACWQAEAPYAIDLHDFAIFVLYTCLSTPPNVFWQVWLEAQFPGYTEQLTHLEKEKAVDDVVTGGSSSATNVSEKDGLRHRGGDHKKQTSTDSTASSFSIPSSEAGSLAPSDAKLNLKNTAIKFALDQTLGASANTFMFIAGIALLRGQSLAQIRWALQMQFWPMIFAGQKLWPAVSILSFTVIPVERRMLFGSIVGLFWGAYLSLLSGGTK